MNKTQWALLGLLSLLWGCSFFLVEITLRELPPLTGVYLRVSLAAMTLWLYVAWRRFPLPRDPKLWRIFAVMAVLNNVLPFSAIVWGQVYITSSLAAILNATTPLFTVILAGAVLADEKITTRKVVGVICGFASVTVMIGPSALRGMGSDLWAQLAVLGAAACYAAATVYDRRLGKLALPPATAAAGQTTVASLMLIPLVIWVDQPLSLSVPSATTWVAVFALAILSIAIAYLIYFRLLAEAGATNLALVTFLIPVSAMLLGVVFLAEQLSLIQVAGMLLIALGLTAIDGRLWQWFTRKH